MRGLLMAIALATTAGMAQADVQVSFRDGAPKDTFTITNLGECATGPMALTIDLAPAPAGLIFDITSEGDGVEVFQPFELIAGADLVTGASAVRDGDQALTLILTEMEAGAEVRFTIDLDDTAGTRAITVSGSETSGAVVLIDQDEATQVQGIFDETGSARVQMTECVA